MAIDVHELKRVVLDRLLVCHQEMVSEAVLRNTTFEAFRPAWIDAVVCRFVTQVLAGTRKERVSWQCSYPADWWQAFKKRWFPEWARRRWPVKMTTEVFEKDVAVRNCPHVDVRGEGPHVAFLTCEEEEWR